MLATKSFSNARPPVEQLVKVRILKPIYVGGVAREIGTIASVAFSDAQAMKAVGRVEII